MNRVPRDRRVMGQVGTFLEPTVNFDRLRRERLEKTQAAMANADMGAMLLTDTIMIRYVTGLSVMPLWTATNLAHYVLVPIEGSPIIFEYSKALLRVDHLWEQGRPAHHWQARFADQMADEISDQSVAEIVDMLRQWGVADATLGIDRLDYIGFNALQKAGIRLGDADGPLQKARNIKTVDEIELMRQSAAIAEVAMYDFEQAIRPGVTENELLAIFWHRMLAMGGEWCFCRLIASGHKTNPWFQEAGHKMVRPGDLVGIDTDMIGPEGYACDFSRTFLCGDRATDVQKDAYKVAHEFTERLAEICKPGASFHDIANNIPSYPEKYKQQRYSVVLHGIGTDDEFPFIPFPDDEAATMPEGELQENMIVCVEFYAGEVGKQDGVKLEDEVLVTKDGPVIITLYPYDDKLLS